jgi:hypothetical protein
MNLWPFGKKKPQPKSWAPAERDDALRMALGQDADEFLALRRTAICLEAAPGQSQPSMTKLGGLPDLPQEFAWPEFKGQPLIFIGQLDLGAVSAHNPERVLPTAGLLSFFYEGDSWGFQPEDGGAYQVHFFEAGPLSPRAIPFQIPKVCHFAEQRLVARPELQWPDDDFLSHAAPELHSRGLDALMEVLETVEEASESPKHQVLGFPTAIQGDMMLESQLVSHGLFCGDARGYKDPRAKNLRRVRKNGGCSSKSIRTSPSE